MHSKRKGNIGETKVAHELTKLGYSVFKELGDISKIDLVVEIQDRLFKIQVKYISIRNDTYSFAAKKSGPAYRFKYAKSDVDIFALYCVEDDKVAWIWADDFIVEEVSKCIKIRAQDSVCANGQTKGVRRLDDFCCFQSNVLKKAGIDG